MNSSTYYKARLARFYGTPDALSLPAVERARRILSHLEPVMVSSADEIPPQHRNLRTLFVTSFRGAPLAPCPGTRVHRCCNYYTVDLYAGCPLGCTYCIMQSYLESSPVTVYADPSPAIAAIRAQALADPLIPLRVGTGETGDSLLFDPLFDLTRRYIGELADLPNVYFEAKTKTAYVDHLLDVPQKGNAVIGFSVNVQQAATEEGASAPLRERIAAASRAAEAGFLVAFHFDPLFRMAEADYRAVAAQLAAAVPARQVAWVSLGSMRYTPGLRAHIDRPYIHDEFVGCADGKYRYIQRERVALYRAVVDALVEHFESRPPIYLCMESEAVWERVFGALPDEMPELEALFAGAPPRKEGQRCGR